MFRNALRQSTRAVSAISASGRVAAVSREKPPSTRINIRSIKSKGVVRHISMNIEDIYEVQLGILRRIYTHFKSLYSSGGRGERAQPFYKRRNCACTDNFGPSANCLIFCVDTKCRTGNEYHRPILRLRCEGFSYRGLLYPRAKDPWYF